MQTDRVYDLTGLKCPMPIIQLTRIMKELSADEDCTVIADDPAFCPDLEAWCRITGNALISCECQANRTVAVIRRGRDE